jgi:elongation factor P
MDTSSFDSYFINADVIGDKKYFLVEWDKTTVMFWDGNPINVQIEASVILEVVDTPPGEKWNSASNNLKPATLNTGLEIKVPLFITQGEKIRVDSRTYDYLGRAS